MSKSWHWELSKILGPVFTGMTLGRCLKLYYENRFQIAPAYLPRALNTLFRSATISPLAFYEKNRYGRLVEDVEIEPPIFVLGHWRGGTTHLHNLLTLDKRFAYPSLFEVTSPLTFLSTRNLSWLFKHFVPPKRPFDNVKLNLNLPYEDEFVAWHCMGLSSYLSWNFPDAANNYDRYLTFRDASEDEIERWTSEQRHFMKKLTWLYNRPLILKSPQHTCKIKLLLSMFPNAKFVHIHRHPLTVFLSTQKLTRSALELVSFQRYDLAEADDRIIRQYREMYDVFFEERDLIPKGNYCEISFEKLEKEPVAQLKHLYETLGLPSFEEFQPDVEAYLDSLSNYKKNKHPEIDPALKSQLQTVWQQCFEEWGYK